MRETLTWNSERPPSCTALATLPPSKEPFKYEDVMWKKGKTRDWEWKFTAGDPNWQRNDGSVDWSGSKMTVGETVLPVVSLLNLAHIQNELDVVDIELSQEYTAFQSDIGETSDGTPKSEKVLHHTAVAVHDDDGGLENSGLQSVVRRIVCGNREEEKMIGRLGLTPHAYVLNVLLRSVQSARAENARSKIGRLRNVYFPGTNPSAPCSKPDAKPNLQEFVKALRQLTPLHRSKQDRAEQTVIWGERARSYATLRVYEPQAPPFPFVGFPKDMREVKITKCSWAPQPKGPGTAQSWTVFGQVAERALYVDTGVRVFENGTWRTLSHPEYVADLLKPRINTLLDIPSFSTNPEPWDVARIPWTEPELAALVNYWMLAGNSVLGSLPSAYSRCRSRPAK